MRLLLYSLFATLFTLSAVAADTKYALILDDAPVIESVPRGIRPDLQSLAAAGPPPKHSC